MKINDIPIVEAVEVPTEKCYWEKWQCVACSNLYPCEVTITAEFNDSQEVIFNHKCLEHEDIKVNWQLVGSSEHA